MYHIVGVNDGEGPPVPIPNTEVKLTGAEDTCLATDRENRAMPTPSFFLLKKVVVYIIPSSYGPLVKRLRRRPLTPKTRVRFSYGSPYFLR